jgi:Mitochondrial ATPase expression
MSAFFLKFEAIESRIASYSCPRGIPGRVHALRLRRCFQSNGRRQSVAVGEQLLALEHDLRVESSHEIPGGNGDTIGRIGTKGTGENSWNETPQPPRLQTRAGATINFPTITTREGIQKHFGHGFGPQVLGDMFRAPLDEDGGVEFHEEEAATALYSALKTGHPHTVFNVLYDQAKLVGFYPVRSVLISMPPATFSEVLRCLDPKHFIGRYQAFHKDLSRRLAKQMGLSEAIDLERGYYQFCNRFLHQIKSILAARHLEYPPSLADYKYLLKCARASGNREIAEFVWNILTGRKEGEKDDGEKLSPDADCYNTYLSIKCWHDTTNPLLRFRLRVIPDNFAPRAWDFPPYSLAGHRVGQDIGIRAQVASLFRQMVEAGISGNEETFCLMIVSMAREGEMSAVAAILLRIWNIDIDLLLKGGIALPPTKSYPRHSPFHPTEMLLYTIAHAFGVNNQIPTALRVIDYISSQYSVPIPINAWSELLQCTFVLSTKPKRIKRHGEPLYTGKDIGQLPPEAVTSLWNTMISKPYNVKPTLEMYNRLISNLRARQRFGEMQVRMEEARRIFKNRILRLSYMRAIFNATTIRPSLAHLAERRMRDLNLAKLHVRRDRKYVERWVRLLIRDGSLSLKYTDGWSDRNVPNIVKNWSLFLPHRVCYRTRSGEVSFTSGSNGQKTSRYRRNLERPTYLERRRLRKFKGISFSGSRGRSRVGGEKEEFSE